MTAVALPVTDTSVSSSSAQSHPEHEAGFALYVGVPQDGAAGRALLADIAEAVVALVEQMAPGATTRSTLALGARSSRLDLVTQVRDAIDDTDEPASPAEPAATTPAAQRARAVWSGQHGGSVVLDRAAHQLTVDGRAVALTFKEYALLEYLLRPPHRVVGRDELLAQVWRTGVSEIGARTIDVHVRRLREKLGGCLQIVTVRGVGYRCDPTPEFVLVGSGDAG
ncbi:winged helix-turn-helix domain-containing protein [Actinotalea subterranea]|uniref:winged helix-turn-helix domain-containing protein n=1 Tax=Actinotalea subterranea TaxID=2607497 RepID=UPI0011EF414A|nr:winged helix-turn-helix domain-containing protein [Actinotalea subterranea]